MGKNFEDQELEGTARDREEGRRGTHTNCPGQMIFIYCKHELIRGKINYRIEN